MLNTNQNFLKIHKQKVTSSIFRSYFQFLKIKEQARTYCTYIILAPEPYEQKNYKNGKMLSKIDILQQILI